MSDRAVAAVAAAAFLGACQPRAVSVGILFLLALGAGTAALRRSPTAVVVATLFVASGLSSHAWNAIDFDVEATDSGTATVATDPERRGGATSAVLTIDGRRYLASAWGQAGWTLAQADAGDRLEVSGRVGIYAASRERIAALRTSHRLSLSSAERLDGGAVHYVVANAYRHLVEDGAVGLSGAQRGLYTGLVYGDDRNQDPLVAADFQGAGLTHLLAVSGVTACYTLCSWTPLSFTPGSPRTASKDALSQSKNRNAARSASARAGTSRAFSPTTTLAHPAEARAPATHGTKS